MHGIDFKNFSLVVNDFISRVLLNILIKFSFSDKIVDAETSFLFGELKEDVYMEVLLV